jgi:hypothetical protein
MIFGNSSVWDLRCREPPTKVSPEWFIIVLQSEGGAGRVYSKAVLKRAAIAGFSAPNDVRRTRVRGLKNRP